MKRIGIIQILQETNCFNPVATRPQDFENFGVGTGAGVLQDYGDVGEIGGFMAGLRAWPEAVEPVGILRLQAWSGGPVAPRTQAWFGALLQEHVRAAGPLDGILIALHGALMGVDDPDMDGWILAQLRALVGPELPIVASLDLHAYVTGTMIRNASALVAYLTFPHVDQRETGMRAAQVLARIFAGARPVSSLVRVPMITGGELQNSFVPPMAAIFQQVVAAEARPEVLSAGILMTQAYLDVPKLGWSVLLVTDGHAGTGERLANDLAAQCWPVRQQMMTKFLEAPACVDRALACTGQPAVIADGADATNSGAGGDSVHLLKELLGRRIPGGALTIMVDPAAVAHARAAGVGGAFDFAVGGKRDHVFSQPLPVKGQVAVLHPKAAYVLNGHGGTNLKIDMGAAAVVRLADVTLLLVEKPGPGSTPLMYRCVGLEPKDFKIVIVKSPAGFRAEFGPFAADIILSDCPGCASNRFASLPYRKIDRPLWPLDEIDDWRAVGWIRES
ncbi:MAG: M81 family metallopeptidase [Opitutales bacterium]